ncbi:hypothetical protein [Bacteroides sp. 51]|uniref:hypothetical protein n=1 Tax=Bacteroides sp. 51 TaxID=2302938 RepID=UPI0013D5DC15|nr:hypothetical protein [Bacteroides sp. 51]NDV81096.1 hypothetical protein [Bacteroides sp. 51]
MDEHHEREKIGLVLSSLRQEKGISINVVTKLSGLKFEQVKIIEEGHSGYTIGSLIRYLDAIKVKVKFSHVISKVLHFIELNKDRNDPVGDVCTDLLRDNDFYDCETDTQRLSYIRGLIDLHSDAVDEAIRRFLKEYAIFKGKLK